MLGFAFAHDIARLAPLAVTVDGDSAESALPYVDIQKVAMTCVDSGGTARRGRMPGLASVAARCLRGTFISNLLCTQGTLALDLSSLTDCL